jgi:hypothetical protein
MEDMTMRNRLTGQFTLLLAVVFFAASFFAPRAHAQAAQVPVAPAGGIDASKLPDIQRIHLGTSVSDTVAKLRALYPEIKVPGYGVTLGYLRFAHIADKPWVNDVLASGSACGNPQCSESMTVLFDAPPNKQGAISIARSLSFEQGKQPTPDIVKASPPPSSDPRDSREPRASTRATREGVVTME